VVLLHAAADLLRRLVFLEFTLTKNDDIKQGYDSELTNRLIQMYWDLI
jgi:hypothetical protein